MVASRERRPPCYCLDCVAWSGVDTVEVTVGIVHGAQAGQLDVVGLLVDPLHAMSRLCSSAIFSASSTVRATRGPADVGGISGARRLLGVCRAD